ncbi:hypothetical protein FQN53_008405 [Emmonsiellopsis sp. PD_33]|nr:hypothetical protein FQN53_008405 [Emmonsiellopsis sp. PD_33]
MRVSSPSLYALALIASTHPVIAKQFLEHPFFHTSATIHEDVRRNALDLIGEGYGLEKRVPQQSDAPEQSPTGQNPPAETTAAPFDEQEFNAEATTACLNALSNLTNVVNPSGMAACFNVPIFDNTTGAFEADIRLYQVRDAVDEFAGIPPSEYTLQVNIPQATISDPRRLAGEMGNQDEMALLQEFRHFGQISSVLQLDKLTQDNIRVLLIPNITIGATNSQNQPVRTTFSSDTISYVAGFFMNTERTPTNITIPEANVQLPAIIAAATEFVLPGTTLGIFPTGLIITGAWTVLFFIAVGYGTLGRMQFRDHYRRRVKMAAAREEGNVRI